MLFFPPEFNSTAAWVATATNNISRTNLSNETELWHILKTFYMTKSQDYLLSKGFLDILGNLGINFKILRQPAQAPQCSHPSHCSKGTNQVTIGTKPHQTLASLEGFITREWDSALDGGICTGPHRKKENLKESEIKRKSPRSIRFSEPKMPQPIGLLCRSPNTAHQQPLPKPALSWGLVLGFFVLQIMMLITHPI